MRTELKSDSEKGKMTIRVKRDDTDEKEEET